jgi:hypothetical protein
MIILKWIVGMYVVKTWTGWNWLVIESSSGLLWAGWWTFGVHRNKISWPASVYCCLVGVREGASGPVLQRAASPTELASVRNLELLMCRRKRRNGRRVARSTAWRPTVSWSCTRGDLSAVARRNPVCGERCLLGAACSPCGSPDQPSTKEWWWVLTPRT